MEQIKFIDSYSMVGEEDINSYSKRVEEIHINMEAGKSKGSNFLGWLHYPTKLNVEDLKEMVEYGKKLNRENDKIFCLGIGGSYLGALASISALGQEDKVFFYGNSFSALELEKGLDKYNPEKDHLIVISKSGTTMETAVAFRLFRNKAYQVLGEASFSRITAITDGQKGSLFEFSKEKNIKRYVVPEDMGGRFSVLSPVGLIPVAACGIDIQSLIQGAREMEESLMSFDLKDNLAYRYAVIRRILSERGKNVEIFATYEPSLFQISNWYKQLFGESEGKEGKGILPVNLLYSTDLHSMGQYVQEGPRNLFETILAISDPLSELSIPTLEAKDGLEKYEGMRIDHMNKSALEGTIKAHVDGGVPNLIIEMKNKDPKSVGALFYFLEKACTMSAYLQGVNPFDQPGVEDYKREMKTRLLQCRE